MKRMKADPRIFDVVFKRIAIDPGSAVYIDDLPQKRRNSRLSGNACNPVHERREASS